MSITGSRRNTLRIVACLQLLVLLAASAPPEEGGYETVPLLKVVEFFDLEYRFSSSVGIVRLEHGGKSVTLILGSCEVFTGDSVQFLQHGVTIQGDAIVVSDDAVDLLIRELLDQPVRWQYERGEFSVQEAQGRTRGPKRTGVSPTQNASAALTVEQRGRPVVGDIGAIVIDAGHGGKDPGGIGVRDLHEKDIVLEVSLELKRELGRRFRNKEIVLTRESDTFLSLEERGLVANGIDPGINPIFISVHANVSHAQNTSGFETYYLSLEPFGEKARDVASRENSVLDFETERASDYIQEIMNHLVDVEYRRESMLLAEYIQGGLERRISNESENRGVKGAFFYVLKESKMPAVLVEIGFVTNDEEAMRLQQSDYQKRIARGISDGIEEFVTAFEKTEGFTMFRE